MNRRQQLARRRQQLARSRKLLVESLEKRMVLDGSPWHNEFDPFDVNPSASAKSPTDGLIALTNFVAGQGGKPVAVPAMPNPDATANSKFDIDNNRVVDRFDLSDLVRHLAATADAPLPPGPM